MERAAFLVAASLAITQQLCSARSLRDCLTLDDATCMRTVGDALLNAAPFDLKPMTPEEQNTWYREVAKPLGWERLRPFARPGSCGGAGEIMLGELVARSEVRGYVCVRLASDATPCLGPTSPKPAAAHEGPSLLP